MNSYERKQEARRDRLEAAARSDDERLAVRYAHPVWVIRAFRRALDAVRPTEVRTIQMAQGQKQSRFIAWTFMDNNKRRK